MSTRSTVVLLVALLVSASLASAQMLPRPEGQRVARMFYENTGGENGVSVFHYRRDGVLGSGVWMLLDRSRYSANAYVYDDAGRRIEKYREFSDGLTSTETYAYDAAGRLCGETFSRSDGIEGAARYHRDAQGRLSSADCDNYKGWLTARIDYEYRDGDKSGAVISDGTRTIGNIVYVYDPDGRLRSETWDFGGRWSQTFTYEYEPVPERIYGASSPLTSLNTRYRVVGEDYDFNGETGGPSRYVYAEGGRLEKKIFRREDGLRTETTYEYDDRGNLLASHRAYHDGRTAAFSYEYDDALRLTAKRFRRSDGAAGYETYSYDRLGRLAGIRYGNMDFWLNGAIALTYDDWGRLDAGRFTGEDGYDADLDIETDDRGNVLSIVWTFDSGKTQTYRFRYGPAGSR